MGQVNYTEVTTGVRMPAEVTTWVRLPAEVTTWVRMTDNYTSTSKNFEGRLTMSYFTPKSQNIQYREKRFLVE